MWGGRQVRIPFPPSRTGWRRYDREKYHGRHRHDVDPNAPKLSGVPRTTELRRVIRKEAQLYRSPFRWVLLVVAWVGGLVGLGSASFPLGAFLAMVALVLAWPAAFARRRWVRGLAAAELLAAGALAYQTGLLAWPGTLLLASGLAFVGQSFTGPDAGWIRKRSRQWIRDHARAQRAQEHVPPIVAKERSRAILDRVRAERMRWRSAPRWIAFAIAAAADLVAMLAFTIDRFSFPVFVTAAVLPAAFLGAFGDEAWLRRVAAGFLIPLGAALAFVAGAASVASVPVVLAGVALLCLSPEPDVTRVRREPPRPRSPSAAAPSPAPPCAAAPAPAASRVVVPTTPELQARPRTGKVREAMRREARILASPVRWFVLVPVWAACGFLVFATDVSAWATVAPGLVGFPLAWWAAFEGHPGVRIVASPLLSALGLLVLAGGSPAWPGLPMLIGGVVFGALEWISLLSDS